MEPTQSWLSEVCVFYDARENVANSRLYPAKPRSVDSLDPLICLLLPASGSTSLTDFVNDAKFLQTVWEPDDDLVSPGAFACCDRVRRHHNFDLRVTSSRCFPAPTRLPPPGEIAL